MEESILSAEMRALEMNAKYLGVSMLQLMENAGHAVAREVAERFETGKTVAIYAGLGGNGGDGLVAARHLDGLGFQVTVILAGRPEQIVNEEAKKNWEAIALSKSIKTYFVWDSSLIPEVKADIIIDALLGIGLKEELRPPILQLVRSINEAKAFKISIDVPTGIDSDTGEVLKEAVKADLTITLHKPKRGLVKSEHAGEIVIAKIGIPREAEIYAGPGDVYLVRKERHPTAHKGQFGRVLIIGGSETYSGAPALSALAALRTGVDLCYIASPKETAYVISSMSPNLITIKLEGDTLSMYNVGMIEAFLPKVDAVIMGPGLGLHRDTIEAVKHLLPIIEQKKIPLLLDADALKIYAGFKRRLETPAVLTPHAGEYEILTGHQPPEDLDERGEHVMKEAREMNACILLKGYIDVISDGRSLKFNLTGNPGMTVGGTGDILSGIVGAFLAQKFSPFRAATAGAFINGAAGDLVKDKKGYHILPTDLLEWIPKLIEDPFLHMKVKRRSLL